MSALKYLVVIGLILAAVGFASEPLGEYIGPIVVIGLILAAVGFTSKPLGEYIGPMEYQEYLGFG